MRCLLVVVLASACGGTVPPLAGGGIEYPKGLYVSKPDRCTASRIGPSIDHHVACDFNRR